jgi:hypothetical protein
MGCTDVEASTHPPRSDYVGVQTMVHDSLNHLSSFNNSHSLNTSDSTPVAKTISIRYAEVLKERIEAIKGWGLNVEICGSWIWVFGANSSHEAALRGVKFNWSYKRGCWYFCPEDYQSSSSPQKFNCSILPMAKIREKYGSEAIYNENRQKHENINNSKYQD